MTSKGRGPCTRQLEALEECERKAIRALGSAQGRGACHKLHQSAAWCLLRSTCPREVEAVDAWQNAPKSSKQRYYFSEAMADLDACLEAAAAPPAPDTPLARERDSSPA